MGLACLGLLTSEWVQLGLIRWVFWYRITTGACERSHLELNLWIITISIRILIEAAMLCSVLSSVQWVVLLGNAQTESNTDTFQPPMGPSFDNVHSSLSRTYIWTQASSIKNFQALSSPSIAPAKCCLTSLLEWELNYPTWQGHWL